VNKEYVSSNFTSNEIIKTLMNKAKFDHEQGRGFTSNNGVYTSLNLKCQKFPGGTPAPIESEAKVYSLTAV